MNTSLSLFLKAKSRRFLFLVFKKNQKKKMEKLSLEISTEEQERILNHRFQGGDWRNGHLQEQTGNKIGLTNQNIIARIRRSSLGYSWSKGTKGGSGPYLCHEDVKNLKLIISAAKDSSPPRTEFHCTTAATRLYLQPHNTNKHFFFSWNWCNLQLPQRAGW